MANQNLDKSEFTNRGISADTLVPTLDKHGKYSMVNIADVSVGDKVFNRLGEPIEVTDLIISTDKKDF